MTIIPLTKAMQIDTDVSYMISLTDVDADYIVDVDDVRCALLGAMHESKTPLDIFKIINKKEMITKQFVSVDVLRKSFPIFFEG